ncbi:DUF2059 domain-containing protein [Lysobacter niabensis]|uniref:DUF2059 domain-containing protein n=1 Tax=Agrilutibacter niabensis TaxID=380628 RepID=UPI0036135C1D
MTDIHSNRVAKALSPALVALALLLGASNASAQETDTPEARAAAVERYLKAMPFDQLMADIATEMATRMPAGKGDDFVLFLTREVRLDVIESAAKQSLAKHLSLEELNALAEFMERPEGKSAMSKMKFYMADVMPVVQQEVARAIAARQKAEKPGG